MIRIAICDSEPDQLAHTCNVTKEYISKRNRNEILVVSYNNPVDLLNEVKKKRPFDIYLLDILMLKSSQIHLEEQIHKADPDGSIVFLTPSSDCDLDSYGIYAYPSIVKPIKKDLLFQAFDQLIGNLTQKENEVVSVKTKNGMVVIPFHKIIFAERLNRAAHFHLTGGKEVESLCLRSSFDEVIKPLLTDPRFLRIHKSFIVNLHHTSRIVSQNFELEEGFIVPISRSSYNDVKKQYMKYLADQNH